MTQPEKTLEGKVCLDELHVNDKARITVNRPGRDAVVFLQAVVLELNREFVVFGYRHDKAIIGEIIYNASDVLNEAGQPIFNADGRVKRHFDLTASPDTTHHYTKRLGNSNETFTYERISGILGDEAA